MIVKPFDMTRSYELHKDEIEQKAIEVLRSGVYILGNEVKSFEEEFANYTGAKYCVGLASGLDALWIALKILNIGIGDEVIVQGNTYIATVMGITMNNATPIFVEPDEFFGMDVNKIEKCINIKTKAILVTHLYGMASRMDKIVELCHKYGLKLIEDCAQSHGAYFDGKMTGTFGDIGCFSFYPTKNLGGFGDSGAIITNNEEIASKIKIFRNYGSERRYYNKMIGSNSRLDELQAGLLRVKLKYIYELTTERENIANYYNTNINNKMIILPKLTKNASSVWHQFVIQTEKREKLIEHLNIYGIGTIIHYPIPPHLAEGYRYLGYKKGDFPITEKLADTILSLPIYNGMTIDEMKYVVDAINNFE